MGYKITTKSGRTYEYNPKEGYSLVRVEDEKILSIYQYSRVDDYYAGAAKYRDKKLLARISLISIEAFEIVRHGDV